MPSTKRTPAQRRDVRTRRVSVPHAESMPRHFMEGDLLQSQIMAVLSATFPKGEQFFVDSVRAFREEIVDPALQRQVAGFIGQESMHAREHDRLNDALHRLGYPVRAVDTVTGAVLGLIQRAAPPSVRLAVTAAAEHYTSVLAEQLLTDDALRSQRIPQDVRHLLLWHALEECEHKAVAFDVYRECVDNEVLRRSVMHLFSGLVAIAAIVSLASTPLTDRDARNPLHLVGSILNLRRSPFARKAIARHLLEYNRHGFHPDDRDTRDLVIRWNDALFGEGGELVGLLAGADSA